MPVVVLLPPPELAGVWAGVLLLAELSGCGWSSDCSGVAAGADGVGVVSVPVP